MDKVTGARRRVCAAARSGWATYRPQGIGRGDCGGRCGRSSSIGHERLGLDDGPAARRVVRVLARLAAWAVGEGLPLDVEVVLDPDTVERFVAVGLADDRSRATYRSVLRRVGPQLTSTGAVGGHGRRRWPAGRWPAPYTRRGDRRVCGRCAGRSRRRAGCGRPGRCWRWVRGPGLDGRWVARVAAADVHRAAGAVLVRVGEPAARVVPVLAGWEDEVVDLADDGRGRVPGRRHAPPPATGPGRWRRRSWSPTVIRSSRRPGCARPGWSPIWPWAPGCRSWPGPPGCKASPCCRICSRSSRPSMRRRRVEMLRGAIVSAVGPRWTPPVDGPRPGTTCSWPAGSSTAPASSRSWSRYFTAETGRHRTISLQGSAGGLPAQRAGPPSQGPSDRGGPDHQRPHRRPARAARDRQPRSGPDLRPGGPDCSPSWPRSSTPAIPVIDAKWFANALAAGGRARGVPHISSSVAVDGTDVETWGALHGDAVTVDLDGEAAETQLMDDGVGAQAEEAGPQSQGPRRRRGRPQPVHRRSGRPGRAPLGHQLPPGRTLRRLRAAPGRAGPGRDVDQLHRQGLLVRRGARRDHLLVAGPGRHASGPGHRRRPGRGQAGRRADR